MKKDNPTADPNVKSLQNFDVTALAPAELERYGIRLAPAVIVVSVGNNDAWITHSEFVSGEGQGFDLYDRAVARRLARDHAARKIQERGGRGGTVRELLEGLELRRSFPCTGMLRVVMQSARMVEVQCDVCGSGYEVARAPKGSRPDPAKAAAGDHSETTPGAW